MPKISVIVPVYNSERYLGKCIESLVTQTNNDLEIILVDDNSTDKSMDIIESFKKKYPKKIKIATTKVNSGAASARNLGLELATGKYIGFIDSDDFITRDYYEKLENACEETSSDMSRTNRRIVCGPIELSFLGRNPYEPESGVIDPKNDPRYLVLEPPAVTNKLFKRSLIGDRKFPENLKWEDYPFAFPLMTKANQVAIVPGKNYAYNLHLNSTTCFDARKLSPKMLDIFTCSDMLEILKEDSNENTRYLINYAQMQNAVQRLKEIVNANIPLSEKRELLTLFSNLIETKYGYWQEHPITVEQKEQNLVHRIRMSLVESLLLPSEEFPHEEETLKRMIKTRLNNHIKK